MLPPQELVLQAAALSPSYAVGSLVLELLVLDIPDCSQAGLRALYDILTTDWPLAQVG